VGEIMAAMELRSLHYFVRIAELGSITRASAHLQIAQPALTRHVQRLEDEVDAVLFTRANRGVRLTEAGHKLLESAQRICGTWSAPAMRSGPTRRIPAARSFSG
jgi:DNA-binding transcriptional LysR family regulator